MLRRRLLLTSLAALSSAATARAQSTPPTPAPSVPGADRMALVLSNEAYPNAPLRTPRDDGSRVARRLVQLGFRVLEARNLRLKDAQLAIYNFSEALQPGTLAVLHFAGYGVQSQGKNYLAPIGVEPLSEAAVKHEMLSVDRILGQLMPAERGGVLLLLDACRINPFTRHLRLSGSGPAAITPPPGAAVVFSSEPGRFAFEGEGTNSPFTLALLDALEQRGLALDQLLALVNRRVNELTNGEQKIWSASALTAPLVLFPV